MEPAPFNHNMLLHHFTISNLIYLLFRDFTISPLKHNDKTRLELLE